jgi:hypothetical protein
VDVTKFNGSDPIGWVTQMQHYFSLYNITYDLAKLWYCVLHLYQERWQWWQWRKIVRQGYVSWTHFVADLYECFDTVLTGEIDRSSTGGVNPVWGCLNNPIHLD